MRSHIQSAGHLLKTRSSLTCYFIFVQLTANHVTHSLRVGTRQHSYLQWQDARRTTTISLTRLTLFFTILSAA